MLGKSSRLLVSVSACGCLLLCVSLLFSNSLPGERRVVLGGSIGTYPGAQSTSGDSEFEFEHDKEDKWIQRVQENQRVDRLTPHWTVVAGPCQGASSLDNLRDCVAREQPSVVANYNVFDSSSHNQTRQEYALRKPASAGVGIRSMNPSLEDVIRANKLPNLKPIYGRMKRLQDQVAPLHPPFHAPCLSAADAVALSLLCSSMS